MNDNLVEKLIQTVGPMFTSETQAMICTLLFCAAIAWIVVFFMVRGRRIGQRLEQDSSEQEWKRLNRPDLQAKGFALLRALPGGLFQDAQRALIGSLRPVESGHFVLNIGSDAYAVQTSSGSIFVTQNGKQIVEMRRLGRIYSRSSEFSVGGQVYRSQYPTRLWSQVELFRGEELVGFSKRQSLFSEKYLFAVHPGLELKNRILLMVLATFTTN